MTTIHDIAVLVPDPKLGYKYDLQGDGDSVVRTGFSVADLFLYVLPRLETPHTAKVNITLIPNRPGNQSPTVVHLIDIADVSWPFSFRRFWSARTDLQKKKLIAVAIRDCLTWLAEHEGWSTAPIESAFGKCLELDLANEFYWKDGKAFSSPDRNRKARLYYRFDTDAVEAFVVVFDRADTELGWKRLFRLPASDAAITYLLQQRIPTRRAVE